ncbi:MAG: hypothetical protein H6733_07860 [Alphaproteobacteria bacterium]|nr:hypothetical protein [Alphaproteobacteria bacterium]
MTATAPKTATSHLRAGCKRTRKDWSGPQPAYRPDWWVQGVLLLCDQTEQYALTWSRDDVVGVERFGSSAWRYWGECARRATGNPSVKAYVAGALAGETPLRLYAPATLLGLTEAKAQRAGQPTRVPHLRLVHGGGG